MSTITKKLAGNPALPSYIIQNNAITDAQAKKLTGLRIMIGTPCYGGQTTGQFTNSLGDLAVLFDRVGITSFRRLLFNESLIQRARNAIANEFVRNGYDYLLFIDADISFNAISAVEMILAAVEGKHRLIGASYPLKSINWDSARLAINDGVPNDWLMHCSGIHVAHAEDGQNSGKFYYPMPIKYLGTGFMLIHRDVFAAMNTAGGRVAQPYRNNHAPWIQRDSQMRAYFDVDIVDETLLSEDYLFCKQTKDLGFQPMLCPWIHLSHFGNISFDGCAACSAGSRIHIPKELLKPPQKP